VRAIVEGAFVGNFDPGYYKSDHKDKDEKIDAVTIVVPGDTAALESAMQAGRIVAESQNFTRDLVNEPSNRMTPTILAERAKKMAADVGLKCEVYGAEKIKELKMGAFWGVAQGSDEPPALIVLRYEPEGAAKDVHLGLVGKGVTFDTGGISIKARRRHGENEVRHGRRGHHDRRHARHRFAQAESEGHGDYLRHRKHAFRQGAKAGRRGRSPCPASPSKLSTPTPKAA